MSTKTIAILIFLISVFLNTGVDTIGSRFRVRYYIHSECEIILSLTVGHSGIGFGTFEICEK